MPEEIAAEIAKLVEEIAKLEARIVVLQQQYLEKMPPHGDIAPSDEDEAIKEYEDLTY